MTLITKSLGGILFNGATLTLAMAPWKGNVRAIYGFNPAGDAYQLFKPTSNFNSLTQLKQDGVYIVDAGITPFELPGATLTAGMSAPTAGPLSFTSDTRAVKNGDKWTLYVFAGSTIETDYALPVLVTVSAPQEYNGQIVPYGGVTLRSADYIAPRISFSKVETVVHLQMIDWRGNIAEKYITLPAVP